jgi:hypothetical protein
LPKEAEISFNTSVQAILNPTVHPMPDGSKTKKENPKIESPKSRRVTNVMGIVIAIFVIFALAGITGVVAWTLLRPVVFNPLIYPATLV